MAEEIKRIIQISLINDKLINNKNKHKRNATSVNKKLFCCNH